MLDCLPMIMVLVQHHCLCWAMNQGRLCRRYTVIVLRSQTTTKQQKSKTNRGKSNKISKKMKKNAQQQVECNFCDYSTRFRSDVETHERTHTNDRPYECKFCGKRFTILGNRNRHLDTYRELFAYKCSNCRQVFAYENAWKKHENHCNLKRKPRLISMRRRTKRFSVAHT